MELTKTGEPPLHVVIADYREATSPVPAALQQLPGVQVAFKQLAVGDYIVDGRCVWERKTVADFASSVSDGRLFIQAQRLASLSQPAALILEGRGSDLAATQMRREALQGAMVSLALVFQLPVLRAADANETARLMIYAAEQLRRHEQGTVTAHSRRPKRKRRLQLRILQGLPGIGPGRATRLLESLGSVSAVMNASQERLAQVDGIGDKTAMAIRNILEAEVV